MFLQAAILSALLFSQISPAAEINLPPIGIHQKLLTFEKSINPENIMVIYTKLDEKCRLETDPSERDQPVFDFYWLMDGKNYKPVHPMIKSGIRDRLEFEADAIPANRQNSFYVKVNDLKEMEHDLTDTRLHIVTKAAEANKCDADAFMTLGASDGNATILLTKIFTEAKRSFLSAKVIAITVYGNDVKTGKAIVRTYKAK
jgi:hypothetical protein